MSQLAQRQLQQPLSSPKKKQVTSPQPSKKRGITKGEKLLYSAFLVVIVFGFYMIISNYASIYLTNYEIQQNESKIEEQLSINEGLELQVMELSDPERILSEAKGMGMVLNEENVRFTHTN